MSGKKRYGDPRKNQARQDSKLARGRSKRELSVGFLLFAWLCVFRALASGWKPVGGSHSLRRAAAGRDSPAQRELTRSLRLASSPFRVLLNDVPASDE